MQDMEGKTMEQILEEYGITICLLIVGFVILEVLETISRIL